MYSYSAGSASAMKPHSELQLVQLDQPPEPLPSPYRSPFFIPSFIQDRLSTLLSLQHPEINNEDIGVHDFGTNNNGEHFRARLQHIAVTILLALKLLRLKDPSALQEIQISQSSICPACRDLNLGRIFLYRTQKIESSRRFVDFQEKSASCPCCKFIYDTLVAEVAESKVATIERVLQTKVTIRSSEAFWHEIVFSLGSDIWAPEARFTPVYCGAWPSSWSKLWTPARAISTLVSNESVPDRKAGVIFDWVRACASHPECVKDSTFAVLPDRVIDVDASQTHVKLREHGYGSNRDRYITLSYCWGHKPQFCLTKGTMNELKDGIASARLPQTIQDAIYLTKQLGCRFLWVDALCIIQDDSEDWQKQCSKMGSIYKNAYLTLHASRSASVHDEFIGKQPPNEIYCGSISHKGYTKPMYLSKSYGYGSLEDFLKSEPLSSRAWAMQERALSRRKVFFGATQMIWQCRRYAVTENGTKLVDAINDPLVPDISSSNHSLWLRKISQFSRLSLTKPSDRLPAISGLANEFGGRRNDEYLAGHWLSSFIVSLLWNTNVDYELEESDQLVAPSWSWASVNGPIDYLPNTILKEKATDAVQPLAKLLEHKLNISTSNLFGEVNSGYIDLQAPILQVKLADLRYKRESRTDVGFFEAFGLKQNNFPNLMENSSGRSKWTIGIYFDFASAGMTDVAGLIARFVVLGRREHRILGSTLCGIIVIPDFQSEKCFRRIGMFDEMFDVVTAKTKNVRTGVL